MFEKLKETYSGKKVFVTGHTGFKGSWLLKTLHMLGATVKGYALAPKHDDDLYNLIDGDTLCSSVIADLRDKERLSKEILDFNPDFVFHLAAQPLVRLSYEIPAETFEVNAIGTAYVLDAVRLLGLEKKTRIYQASTSELYGKVQEVPQSETTPFYPRSPYAVAKMYAFWITVNYREAYGMYACNGILFNHESPIRGETFVTRKITRATSKIALGLQDKFYLGNLDAKRDWGHAKDYVRMMWMILQADEAEDWVIATGTTTPVREFVRMSFAEVGIELEFKGEGVNEKAFVKACNNPEFQLEIGKEVLAVDPKYFRPTEVDLLIGDPTKAKTKLGWECQYDLQDLVKDMMQSDLKLMQKDQYLKEGGYRTLNYFE